ncbi:MAG: pilus assembly protein TadG-related protein [Actinomycetota bacterium]|nr:pilus assembly protein TadG-related protein [Actinomycetota bacterium]
MRGLREEDGAIAILTAVLLVAVFGFAAISIDVGVLYEERRQLQNGADAAALAAAWDCAEGVIPCAITGLQLNNTVDTYADRNARDSDPALLGSGAAADIVELNLTDQYITVETSTVSNGNGFLRNWFAGIIGHETSTVRARATAAWGQAGGATTLPLTFSYCEWSSMVPDLDSLPSVTEIIDFHTATDTSDDCVGPAGQDTPGGFGWLDPVGDESCSADVTSDQEVGGDTGNPTPTAISDACDRDFWRNLIGQTVLIPIFSEIDGTGSGATYYIEGFAAFVVEGYSLTGGGYSSTPPPNCSSPGSSGSCLKGHFVEYVSYADYDPDAGDYGVTAVALTN